uniref:ATP-dependent rRNA helicase SPB4-like C-terminal extension domain-containing protein n=1 Tax=Timema tahoe TaxID=61484 RepID=A0A7R9FF91_9NEOP|nr:unnamed protein product [Timema tahoe]
MVLLVREEGWDVIGILDPNETGLNEYVNWGVQTLAFFYLLPSTFLFGTVKGGVGCARSKLRDPLGCLEAYVSWVRFYASYPKEVREVFCFKALHMGHYAKSFALRDPPKHIAGIGKRQGLAEKKLNRLMPGHDYRVIAFPKRGELVLFKP